MSPLFPEKCFLKSMFSTGFFVRVALEVFPSIPAGSLLDSLGGRIAKVIKA